ncbi:unnamed protein product [Clavelina lepadiformis]|uniref:Major facilitator superfamily (MFS) profile domain-containing protein n=1 Tax=Clavelina lepadiformis TaxID=159417 RepID=A0ABP0GCX4_CLALP
MRDMPKENNIAEVQVSENLLGGDGIVKHNDSTKDSISKVSSNVPRYLMTAALSAGFFGVGSSLSILGLALPTLASNLNKTIDDVSLVLIARGGGYVSGSFIAGILER